MNLAIIPARGGSKRIPNKNVIDFFGRPMLHYSLRAARESGLFDAVHVSTDSRAIADAAAEAGFPVGFMRPPELADDKTPIMPVLAHVLDTYEAAGRRFETVAVIYPCAPLIEASDLVTGYEIFTRRSPRRPLMAVGAFPVPVEWAYRRAGDGSLTPVHPGAWLIRSQDLETKYYDSGTFYFYDRSHLGATPVSDADWVSCVLPKQKAVDIDDEEDLKLAHALFAARQAVAESTERGARADGTRATGQIGERKPE